ncbi:MmgE/PrpD family protein [Caldovatus aquaticus]|uniref:MmgE/PrpD family protein n=1 Tax=Caldovatus aquaticus TaxID=2865671 RepID=A0ABS7EYL3_9PROT|nr:MmgE/PrpD family protein [Caldovatus aquaticus]MBW8268343.1 MmgE/PrpD family protein [Caldovatus aquaticus]
MERARQDPAAFAGQMLGDFVARFPPQEVPAALRHEAKRALLNVFGCALAVARDPAVDAAVRVLRPLSGPGAATAIGRPERLDPMAASFVNAMAANLLDYDDTHLDTVIHPTAPVAPPVLALAEARGLSGAAALHAFLLGAEVACRLGNAVSPGHYARGWHITATCGVFGAAAACARLLGLSGAQSWSALGIAASQAAGVVESLPSAAKNVGVGNAARNGLFAALLAQQGYAAAPAAIEGPLGWARAAGDEPRLAALGDGLGERWEFGKNTYKPYPCGIVLHPVIDACLALRAAHGLAPDAVAGVRVRGHPLLLARGDRAVENERDARVSIHHSVAVALVLGAAGVREFSPAAVADPAIAAFRAKVRAEADDSLPVGAAAVTVETTGGAALQAVVTHARGSRERPLSDRELEAKFEENARLGGFGGRDVARLIAQVWRLDEADSVRPLLRALSAPRS